jgi:hypothetical protein
MPNHKRSKNIYPFRSSVYHVANKPHGINVHDFTPQNLLWLCGDGFMDFIDRPKSKILKN